MSDKVKMNKFKKIYHYAPISPAITACKIEECSYYYTTVVADVNCKECLKEIAKKEKAAVKGGAK